MITQDNIKELLQSFKEDFVRSVINEHGDYIVMELHVFNCDSYATLNSMVYDEAQETIAGENGDLYCDKDTFLQLAKELDINWNI